MIWKFVGCVSAINGLVCFALSSTYNMSFGKWGFRGLLAYLFLGLMMLCLMLWAKRVRVSQKVQGLVVALIFDVICLISVLQDELLTGKSDALSIISCGSFALMSPSMSRKFELGFETGFSSFFLSLFVAHLCKTNWNLLPIALVFCSVIIILRHRSEPGLQFGSISPYHPNSAVIEIGNEDMNGETQGMREDSGQSLLSTNNQQNNQEESSEATHHSPRNGGVSEGSILDWNNLQNNEEEGDRSSLQAESWDDQNHVSSGNNTLTIQHVLMLSCGEPNELISLAPPRELLRDCGGGIQLNTWQLPVCDGRHSTNPGLMHDPSRRVWLYLEEAALMFRMVEEADLELMNRRDMRILVKPKAADSGDDPRTSSPTSVLQITTDAEEEEEEEEEGDQ